MSVLAMLLAAAAGTTAVDYDQDSYWLCRPGRQDICAGDLTMTRVDAKGRARVVRAPKARPSDVDCFYIYPTASLDPGDNSDLTPGPGENGLTTAQFAPFRSVCRTFAPIYRQVTLTALRKVLVAGKQQRAGDFELAYGDVVAAWRNYLRRDNGGRPFVLVGHSQGSAMLKRLVAEEIDGKPIQKRMLSAILPGTAVLVPAGRDVGASFKSVPLCRSARQTGCVVTWASYRAGAPLVEKALFGRSEGAGVNAGCTNPARLAGGEAPLDPILGFPWWNGGYALFATPKSGWPVTTQFVQMPGLLSGECVTSGGFTYLAVKVARTGGVADTVAGTGSVGDAAFPDWGFHVIDMAVVEGDLLRLVAAQHAAWRAKVGRK
ncbi:MAG: hypothetical protein JWR80_1815 [Bradyrhizobium sp.]|nr:hypothetical protein [Bradyrhizobium sp.]